MLELLNNPLLFIMGFGALVIAITIHEFAHAFAANRLGDPTPRLQGRLTLNPLSHLDPLGTILIVLIGFGWGRPVMFDPYNLENPRRDAAVISLAGPASNIVLAILLGIAARFVPTGSYEIFNLIATLVYLNIILAVFNLIPVHPLDGHKIITGILPYEDARQFDYYIRRYGTIMLLALILPLWNGTSLVSTLIVPVARFLTSLILTGSLNL